MPPNLPRPFDVTAGPFVGVRDAVELSAQDLSRAAAMTNAIIVKPEVGGDAWQRPGFSQLLIPSNLYASNTIAGPIYGLTTITLANGTTYNLVLVHVGTSSSSMGAGVFTYTSGVTHYVKLIQWTPDGSSFTNAIVAGGTTILNPATTANRFFFTSLGDYLIITQSGGSALKFDPITGTASALTDFTVAPYGRPVVYYGKLFFIRNDDRTTLNWSEENDPDIGYDATGYDNFWTLRQTSNSPMTGLAATNQYLYIFRGSSITSIEGAVNSDFRSAGVLEGVSLRTGCLSPDSIDTSEGGSVWFLDQFCRPHKIEPGRGLVPLWANCERACRGANKTASVQFGNWGRFHPELEVVVFRVAQTTGNPKLLVFSSRTDEYLGEWSMTSYAGMEFGETLFDSTGRETLCVTKDSAAAPLNFAYQKPDDATDQRDVLSATATPSVAVRTPRLYSDIDMVVNGMLATVSTQRFNDQQATLKLSSHGSPAQAWTTPATMAQADVSDNEPGRAVYGINDALQSRWLQLEVTNDTTETKRTIVGQIRVTGTQQRVDPALP